MFDGAAGQRTGVGEQLLLGVGQRVRRAAEDVVEVERGRPSAAAPTAMNRSIVALPAFRISGSMYDGLRAERRRPAASSPAACPGAWLSRVS